MKIKYILYVLIIISVVAFGCAQKQIESMEDATMEKSGNEDTEFKQMCQNAGYEWMLMNPTQDGKFIKDAQECWGCMVEGIEHICDKEKFYNFILPR